MYNEGFIKLFRQLKGWRYYDSPNALAIWIHILLNANWQEKQWHTETIEKGSFITSQDKLAEECGVTKDTIRYYLGQFNHNEILVKTTNKNTKITVINWDFFQDVDTDNPTQNEHSTPHKPQPNTKQTPTTKEYKEYKEIKEERKAFSSSKKEELGYDPKDYVFGWFNYGNKNEDKEEPKAQEEQPKADNTKTSEEQQQPKAVVNWDSWQKMEEEEKKAKKEQQAQEKELTKARAENYLDKVKNEPIEYHNLANIADATEFHFLTVNRIYEHLKANNWELKDGTKITNNNDLVIWLKTKYSQTAYDN